MIVRTSLPPPLERLRRASIADAAAAVPAHLTLLYPFVEPERLDRAVRELLANVAATIEPFDYRLTGPARFPDTVYVAVEPNERFVALQAAFGLAFPAFPIYGPDWAFEFVPHVSVAEGSAVIDPVTLEGAAWRSLPQVRRAARIDVIVRDAGGRWRTRWRIPLGRPGRSARG
ncbi:MAG TPA: 2'-5' RNA ligase family protein [Candidatus Limnocylindria bacterium]|nr:2'-5' RNA ligase family protein [Candidatus Limnocylindria bacterium]